MAPEQNLSRELVGFCVHAWKRIIWTRLPQALRIVIFRVPEYVVLAYSIILFWEEVNQGVCQTPRGR